MNCPLCTSKSQLYHQEDARMFYRCSVCYGIFVNPSDLPKPTDEKQRYLAHNNHVTDVGYQNFVQPLVNLILQQQNTQDRGLDYGAGTGPVVAKLLQEKQHQLQLYDPFFKPDTQVLQQTYDYIICCEVIEHFHEPYQEFQRLKKLLKPGGKLYAMTHVFTESIDFSTWYYKNDFTHVFFYPKKSLTFIKNEFGFQELYVNKRLICWSS